MIRKATPIEKIICYKFKRKKYLKLALTHSSATKYHKNSYQRLEFLGDSILAFIVSDYLFKIYPEADEGELTSLRQTIVSSIALAKISKILGLGKFLRTGNTIDNNEISDSILSDVLEALIAAIYIDSGLNSARKFVEKCILSYMAEGPEHKIFFKIAVFIEDKMLGVGLGNTKKEAEQNAAKDAIQKLIS
jgi:ribonuclease-3